MKKTISLLLVLCLLLLFSVPAFATVLPPDYLGATTYTHYPYVSRGDTFGPDESLTRAETANMIYVLMAPSTPNGYTVSFSDVNPGDWYYDSVMALAAAGAVSGYPDGRFGPGDYVTRAQFVKIISSFFDIPRGVSSGFPDVGDSHWARDAIAYARSYGWISGYPNGNFGPNDLVTRAEAVTILNKVSGRKVDRAYIDSLGGYAKFSDVPQSHWAYYEIMEATVEHSFTSGGDGESWKSSSLPAQQAAPTPTPAPTATPAPSNEIIPPPDQFFGPTQQVAAGYRIIDGDLYKVDSYGNYYKNYQDGVLYFGADGRYTSGDAELDAILKNIVVSLYSAADSMETNLKRLYDHVCWNYSYLARMPYPADGSTGWDLQWAKQMVQTGKGNCYSYAALFSMLARRLGYQAWAVSGFINVSTVRTFEYHGWVEISQNGKIYVCDPEIQAYYSVRVGRNWSLFMFEYMRNSFPDYYPEYMVAGQVKP